MSIHVLRASPSPTLMAMVEQSRWDELAHAVKDGAPATAPARGQLNLFETFLVRMAPLPADDAERASQHRAFAALLEAWPGNDAARLTPLTLACLSGRDDLVRMLLEAGHDPNEQGERGHNPASAIAFAGIRDGLVIGRQRARPDVNWDGPIMRRRLSALGVLCAHGLDLDRPSFAGAAPMTLACLAKHVPCGQFLLSSGANPNPTREAATKQVYALSPLEAAIVCCCEPLASALVHAGARLLDPPTHGDAIATLVELAGLMGLSGMLDAMRTRLSLDHPAFRMAWMSALIMGNDDVVNWCVDHGFGIDRPLPDGRRPVHVASRHGHQVILMRLLAAGADMSAMDPEGRDGWSTLAKFHPALSHQLRPMFARGQVIPFRC